MAGEGLRLKPVLEVSVYLDGRKVMDELTGEILLKVKETGSILSAAKELGIPYSRAWRRLASLERELGGKVIRSVKGGKGGGGATLTELGKELLNAYLMGKAEEKSFEGIVIASSHDPLLEASSNGLRVRWVGSSAALLYLAVGEADVAGIHILDVDTGEYNTVVRKLFPGGEVLLVRGFRREVGWAFRPGTEPDLRAIRKGRLKLALRNRGSGTRILLEKLLGFSPRGEEFYRHDEICLEVAEGRADLTLTLRETAERYGLEFKPVCWEQFDFALAAEFVEEDSFREFKELLSRIRSLSLRFSGYQIPEDMGRVVSPKLPRSSST